MNTKTKIKICGLTRERDIDIANQHLPDYIGFVLHYPKSRRYVSVERAQELGRLLNPGIRIVGVLVDQPLETAVSLLNDCVVDIVQLHGHEDENYIRMLKERTGKQIWKAFQIHSPEDVAAARTSSADMLVLDSGMGSGESFDWSLIADFDRPYFLAGGINPQNAVRCVKQLHPYGIDLSSGVETNGVKDKGKISSVIHAVRGMK